MIVAERDCLSTLGLVFVLDFGPGFDFVFPFVVDLVDLELEAGGGDGDGVSGVKEARGRIRGDNGFGLLGRDTDDVEAYIVGIQHSSIDE